MLYSGDKRRGEARRENGTVGQPLPCQDENIGSVEKAKVWF